MDFNILWMGGVVLLIVLLIRWNIWSNNKDRENFFKDLVAERETEKSHGDSLI